MRRLFFVAGESSGDTHGAHLIRALHAIDPAIACEGLGGAQMAAAGMTLRHDLAGEAIMGFTEVVKHFLPIRRLFLDTVAHLTANPPDCVVLIDYPGFNLRLAKALDGLDVPIVYYISPQVWAWKKKRVHALARYARKMLVIFPFEEPLYRAVGMDCSYVGHPLIDHIGAQANAPEKGEFVIGVLPGSRAQEISRLLAPMLGVARGIRDRHPEARFLTPCVSAERGSQIRALSGDFPIEVIEGGMHEVLRRARFCLVASGTATLETALFGVPLVLVYRTSPVTFWLAKRLVDIEHIGIVNILLGRRAIPEFLQADATPEKILSTALDLIEDTPARRAMLEDLRAVRETLGGGGASHRAATEILSLLST